MCRHSHKIFRRVSGTFFAPRVAERHFVIYSVQGEKRKEKKRKIEQLVPRGGNIFSTPVKGCFCPDSADVFLSRRETQTISHEEPGAAAEPVVRREDGRIWLSLCRHLCRVFNDPGHSWATLVVVTLSRPEICNASSYSSTPLATPE